MQSIKDMVKDKFVTFTHYRRGEMWYVTECGFEFPVPVSDIGDATFQAKDKAILMMRYIRQHITMLESAKTLSAEKAPVVSEERIIEAIKQVQINLNHEGRMSSPDKIGAGVMEILGPVSNMIDVVRLVRTHG